MQKKIRTITVNRFEHRVHSINSGSTEVKELPQQHQEFDRHGNMVLEVRYNQAGTLEEKTEYTFDADNRLVAETIFLEDSEAAETKSYTYDDQGRLSSMMKHYLDGAADTTKYHYNDHNELVETETTDDEGILETTERFTRENGRLTSEELADGEGNLLSRRTIKYDEAGRVAEVEAWSSEEEITIITRNGYNEEGVLISVERISEEGELIEANYFAKDEEGVQIASTENGNGPQNQIHTVFNEAGLPIREEEITPEGDVVMKIERRYNEEQRATEAEVSIDGQGRTFSRHYFLKYEYSYFED